MVWIIFGVWMFWCFLGWLISSSHTQAEEELKTAMQQNTEGEELEEVQRRFKYCEIVFWVYLGISLVVALLLLLYGIGWVWYYFCSGFLVFEDQPFWDKVICGLFSLIPLGFLIGCVAIWFGWDPWRK